MCGDLQKEGKPRKLKLKTSKTRPLTNQQDRSAIFSPQHLFIIDQWSQTQIILTINYINLRQRYYNNQYPQITRNSLIRDHKHLHFVL